MALVHMARQPDASADLKAVCTGIGAGLRALHSDVLREAFPERIADKVRQLERATERSQGGDSAQHR